MMEKVYKVVIIDDEECAIDNLCFELKKYDFISVEGTARNGISGIKLVEKVHPDLIFQDVELPDMLGMDVVSKIHDKLSENACIIFYTVYNKYVLDAFRNYAFDFLLKPIDSKELELVMTRFIDRMHSSAQLSSNRITTGTEGEKPFMVVTPTGDLRFLRASEIGYFRYLSNRKIWEVALSNGTFLPLKRNTTAEQLCAYDSSFIQVHQSYIINMNFLIMVQDNRCIMYPPFNQSGDLLVSKKYKKEMMDRFYQL